MLSQCFKTGFEEFNPHFIINKNGEYVGHGNVIDAGTKTLYNHVNNNNIFAIIHTHFIHEGHTTFTCF